MGWWWWWWWWGASFRRPKARADLRLKQRDCCALAPDLDNNGRLGTNAAQSCNRTGLLLPTTNKSNSNKGDNNNNNYT
jgi:hypothetical protein